jgi:hypothetical protein
MSSAAATTLSPGRNKVRVLHGTLARNGEFYVAMPDFPIDPELRIRVSPPGVLRCTTEAMTFIRKMTLGRAGRAWLDVQQSFEDAWDEWSAMQAVVKLEMLLAVRKTSDDQRAEPPRKRVSTRITLATITEYATCRQSQPKTARRFITRTGAPGSR